MLRDTVAAVRDPLGYLRRSVDVYGPMVSLPAGPGVLHVARPDAVTDLLVRRNADFSKRTPQYDALAVVTGGGLLVDDDPPWRARRRAVQPSFHRRVLDKVVAESVTAAELVAGRWVDQSPRGAADITGGVHAATTRVVRRCFFHDGPPAEVHAMIAAGLAASAGIVDRAVVPVTGPEWLPLPGARRSRRLLADVDATVAAVLRARAREGRGEDALGLLLAAVDSGLVDPDAVQQEAMTLVLAGQETAASTLAWACLILAEDAALQERVRAEAISAGSLTGVPSVNVLGRLPLARAVLDEVLRLYPPAWVISRRAVRDTTVGGVHVPAGVFVIASPFVVHRQGSLWPRPDTFDPDRWLASERPRPGTYLPFGLGARMCIGRDVALVEGTTILATLLRHARIDGAGGGSVGEWQAKVTLRPSAPVRRRVRPIEV